MHTCDVKPLFVQVVFFRVRNFVHTVHTEIFRGYCSFEAPSCTLGGFNVKNLLGFIQRVIGVTCCYFFTFCKSFEVTFFAIKVGKVLV
jgi:hypothetical protein